LETVIEYKAPEFLGKHIFTGAFDKNTHPYQKLQKKMQKDCKSLPGQRALGQGFFFSYFRGFQEVFKRFLSGGQSAFVCPSVERSVARLSNYALQSLAARRCTQRQFIASEYLYSRDKNALYDQKVLVLAACCFLEFICS
jgi:hypothetical protein